MQHYQKILIAVDGSDQAEKAFKKAANVALRNKATLYIAHIIDMRAFQSVTSFDDEMADRATAVAKNTLTDYENYAKKLGVEDIQTVIEYGAPKTLIAKQLPTQYGIDLVMMGATGLNAVERLLIGSVSEYVIRHAPCDVLVVRTDLDNTTPSA
ncbi:universal stress protein [Vagococcus humatus]|uniref:Universal stress protein n=1 Tax=Vagococcus humatus TaxID=1889241 RepID=A0A429Z9K9_9ENTE|nr:universal stress protein [Vagococcus humatus]RST90399.1 universal stress protein UspA [Vagococcus humatus]